MSASCCLICQRNVAARIFTSSSKVTLGPAALATPHRKATGRRHNATQAAQMSAMAAMPLEASEQKPPLFGRFWQTALAPETLQEQPRSRREELERIIMENAAPDPTNYSHALPVELHALAQELLQHKFEHVSTATAVGTYLDALCRRERLARRETIKMESTRRLTALRAAADPFQSSSPLGPELPSAEEALAEADELLQRAIGVFKAVQKQSYGSAILPSRFVGSFLETLARGAHTDITEQVVAYYRSNEQPFPVPLYPLVVFAYAEKGDKAGLDKYRAAYLKEMKAYKENVIMGEELLTKSEHRLELPEAEVWVEEKLETLDDITARLNAYYIRGCFKARKRLAAGEVFSLMLEGKTPASLGSVAAYFAGRAWYQIKEMMSRLQEAESSPHLGHLVDNSLVYRAIIRAIINRGMSMDDSTRPVLAGMDKVNVFYLRLIGRGIPHSAIELDYVVTYAIANAMRIASTSDKSSAEAEERSRVRFTERFTVLQAYKFWNATGGKDQKNLLMQGYPDTAGSASIMKPSERTYRLPLHTVQRLCSALAMHGYHDRALHVWRDLLDHAQVGLLLEGRPYRDEGAFYNIGLIALGAHIKGARPSLPQILFFRAQQEIHRRFWTSPWVLEAAKHAAQFCSPETLTQEQRNLYDRLLNAEVRSEKLLPDELELEPRAVQDLSKSHDNKILSSAAEKAAITLAKTRRAAAKAEGMQKLPEPVNPSIKASKMQSLTEMVATYIDKAPAKEIMSRGEETPNEVTLLRDEVGELKSQMAELNVLLRQALDMVAKKRK